MKQHNSYAAGRKQYGGGRSNPTSGTVNPTGYIDRAANKKASQRRSGLAKMALTRRLGTGVQPTRNLITPGGPDTAAPNLTTPGAPDPTPTGQTYSTQPNPTMPLDGNNAEILPSTYGQSNQGPLARDAAGNVGHATPDQVAAGQWQPPVDPEAEAQAAEYEAQRQQYLTELLGQETNFRSAAGRRLRDLEIQKPKAHEGLLNDFASRGLAYSGRYATDMGDLENQFAQQATDTNEGLNANLAQIAAARAGKNSEIQALLQKNLAASAARNASNPAFRAPTAPAYNFTAAPGGEDELAIAAIKRRLAAGGA